MSLRRACLRAHRGEDGATATEFVFIAPVLIVLVFGIIQFGFALNRQGGMHSAARAGARAASLNATVAEVETAVGNRLDSTLVSSGDVDVAVFWFTDAEDPGTPSSGTDVTGLGTVLPCDDVAAHTVRVDIEISPAEVPDYSISVPFLPTYSPTYASTGIFRCEG